jgi:hypothetical protein
LISIKFRRARVWKGSLRGSDLLKTYTLYLRDGGGDVRFEPALCGTDAQAMARARELLQRHEVCEAIDVHLGDDFICRVNRPPP